MYSQRVQLINGKTPILVVAPHGFQGNDENTAIVAETIAGVLDAYAVINHGWERDDYTDFLNDKADCNNVVHCHEDVVKDEFLDPIIRFKNRILRTFDECFIFYIHGMADRHRTIANDPSLSIVIGYGAGSPNSYSCDIWRKDYMISLLSSFGLSAYQGAKGGTMSGWARSNMNQLFRKWYPEPEVQSMQIEIIHDLRADTEIAIITGEYIANAIYQMVDATNFIPSQNFQLKSY